LTYIETSSQFPVQVFDPEQEISPPVGSLLLSFGDTVSTRKVISSSELVLFLFINFTLKFFLKKKLKFPIGTTWR